MSLICHLGFSTQQRNLQGLNTLSQAVGRLREEEEGAEAGAAEVAALMLEVAEPHNRAKAMCTLGRT